MKALLSSAVSLLAMTMMTGPASAMEAPGQDVSPTSSANDDAGIVVTARRVEERLQDVPVAITAVRGERLEQLGISQVADLRQVVSGLNVTAAAGRTSTPIYAIRGQRAADTVITQDPPVAVYMDDVLVSPLSGSNLGLFDLENVQVLKGPQGTLFGRNTTGGAILFTTAKPTSEFGGSIKVGYGNYDAKSATVVLNLPVNEAIRLRAAADWNKSDGFGSVVAGPHAGDRRMDRDDLSLRFSAAIDPMDWLKSLTTVYYGKSDTGGPTFTISTDTPRPGGVASFVFDTLGNGALTAAINRQRARSVYDNETAYRSGSANFDRTRLFGINNTISIELSDDLTLKNIFGYRRLRYSEAIDFDGTVLPLLDTVNFTNTETYSEELQLQGSAFDNRLTYIFGTYFYQQKGLDGTGKPGGLLGTVNVGGRNTVQNARVKNSSLSGFGQVGVKLTETVTLDAGLRYTVDRRRAAITSGTSAVGATVSNLATCNFRDAAGNPLPAEQCLVSNSRSFAEPSWLVGFNWKPTPDMLVYIANRHSYRAGGFNLRANAVGFANASFKPEQVTDVELGLKNDFRLGGDWRLTTNVAGYYQWYKDIQRNVSTVSNGVIGNITSNAAKAHIYGGEAEIELRSGRFFSLGLNYAYVKPKYDSYPTQVPVFGVPNQPDDYSNRRFPYIPRHQINANLTLSPEVGDIGDLHLTANLYYQSKVVMQEDYNNREQLIRRISPATAPLLPNDTFYGESGYALVNLRAELEGIAGTGLSAGIWAKNIFDKRYVNAGALFQDSLGASFLVYGPPRTYGLDLRYTF